tara:strand:+ start:18 stop:605 length:588 start_codon:yes stop_codon:yes gene_type:complete
MAHTITLIADYKGFTKPKVVGDEYRVRAKINITTYREALVTTTCNIVAAANTITEASGTSIFQPTVGRHIQINDPATANNGLQKLVTAATATVITVDATDGGGMGTNATNDEIAISHAYELLTATEFGLSSISSLKVIGQESILHQFMPVVGVLGDTTLASPTTEMELSAVVQSTGLNAATGDLGFITVEVMGHL